MRTAIATLLCSALPLSAAETKTVRMLDDAGMAIEVATLTVADDGSYALAMNDAVFTDHFLSMRPFRCIEGPSTQLCYVPYPYENARNLSDDLIDLEYDLLFVWKAAGTYGIDMWNGMYWRLEGNADGRVTGQLHEMNMDDLAVPPAAGELRPIGLSDLEPADTDSHWLPHLVIE